ncbi:claudin-8 [Clarias gariepinus]|uniref:claudin-8 n=1 Tax=Clarias gariepinus TaxID=13013 RepID=UPI00234DF887|nr:claudin-8 [Clarias gariepinus]
MAGQPMELAALFLTLLGFIGVSASTGMPMWKVTAFIQENIIVMETRWEGLWMNCYRQANIRMQCKVYDSLLYLPPELQASRGLMCCSVALAAIGLFIAITGMKCTACIQGNDRAKRIVLIVAGCLIMLACLCCLIPVSWTANVIIQDFYNPLLIDAQRRELGEALYVGWVSSVLLFAGGCIFLCCSGSNEKRPDQSRIPYKRDVPYVAYQPQPQPAMYQPRSAAAYSFSSREPSFIQTSTQPSTAHTYRQHSFVQPSRQHSFVQPVRQHSFVQPSRQVSVRSGVDYL